MFARTASVIIMAVLTLSLLSTFSPTTKALATPPGYPHITVEEPTFGPWVFIDIEPPLVVLQPTSGIPMEFSWVADATWYGGTIAGYRYGWDLTDPSDTNDPGWATPSFEPGLLATGPMSFQSGVHTLHIMVVDDNGSWVRVGFLLDIQDAVPVQHLTWGELKTAFGSHP